MTGGAPLRDRLGLALRALACISVARPSTSRSTSTSLSSLGCANALHPVPPLPLPLSLSLPLPLPQQLPQQCLTTRWLAAARRVPLSQSLGFLYGAYMEDFGYCVYAWFGGCCLACLVRQPLASVAACYHRAPVSLSACSTAAVRPARRSASQSGVSSTATQRSGWIRQC